MVISYLQLINSSAAERVRKYGDVGDEVTIGCLRGGLFTWPAFPGAKSLYGMNKASVSGLLSPLHIWTNAI